MPRTTWPRNPPVSGIIRTYSMPQDASAASTRSTKNIYGDGYLILAIRRDPQMSEKRGRGQPKFEPNQEGSPIERTSAIMLS
jgi:hypothetical protein